MGKRMRLVLMVSVAVFVVSLITAQMPHSTYPARTITTHKTTYDSEGKVETIQVQRKSWLRDGSSATQTITSVPSLNTVNHEHHVIDLEHRLDTITFPKVGLKLVRRIPETMAHRDYVTPDECVARVSSRGLPVDGNLLVRREAIGGDGATLVRRFDPELGCEAVEAIHRDPTEKLRSELRTLTFSAERDLSLFEIDPSLRSATRMQIQEAYLAKFGEPFVRMSDEAIRELDRKSQLVLDD